MIKSSILYIVVPCYNEEEILRETSKVLLSVLEELTAKGKISPESKLLFVDDGSKDKTWEIISDITKNPNISGIKFYKNYGHQCAVHAGLNVAREYADIMVSIDADLQDDVNSIEEMIDKYNKGYDIVCGVRSQRDTDEFLKRFTAEQYYKFLKKIDVNIIYNHADFRLMSKRAVDKLMEFEEHSLFLRGMIFCLGYPVTTVEYARKERFGGESKYKLSKMLRLAYDGVISFSKKPLKLPLWFFAVSLVLSGILSVLKIVFSLNIGIYILALFLFSLIMLCETIMCSYLGSIVNDVKIRPRYIINEEKLNK